MGYIRVLRGLDQTKSLIFPAVASKGACVQEKSSNVAHGELATNKFAGVLIQEVTDTGPDFAVQNAGIPTDEIPKNHAGLLRLGEGEIVTDFVASGSDDGKLADADVGANLGIASGKWREAQEDDLVFGQLLEKDVEVSGRFRIQVFRTAVVTPGA